MKFECRQCGYRLLIDLDKDPKQEIPTCPQCHNKNWESVSLGDIVSETKKLN